MRKLLYLADRESLKKTGRPITGDRVVAMEHGPVLRSVSSRKHIHHAFTRRAWPPRAIHSHSGAVLTGRTVQLLLFGDRTHMTSGKARFRVVLTIGD
jgi:hypothetical protein